MLLQLVQCKNKGSFDIFDDVSDHITLLQLEDLSGNINHAASITRCCIYDSNYKIALLLM